MDALKQYNESKTINVNTSPVEKLGAPPEFIKS